ncbi:MAG: hypothetical protein ACM3MK_03170, partial [Chitinophagales bacterium]
NYHGCRQVGQHPVALTRRWKSVSVSPGVAVARQMSLIGYLSQPLLNWTASEEYYPDRQAPARRSHVIRLS